MAALARIPLCFWAGGILLLTTVLAGVETGARISSTDLLHGRHKDGLISTN